MSYYNDSFALALEQQSYELDNMLAELDSYGSIEASGALESVQNTVAGIYDVDACDDLLDKLAGVTESYNSALEQMRDAAEMYQYTEDRESTMEAMYPAQESLKAIYSNIVGYAPEGNVSTDMVETIHDFILGSREIIEGKMMELGGYAGESSSYYDGMDYDYATESYGDINYPLCEAYANMNIAFESYYDCMEAGYAEYGYAFEAEATGAEKAKKQGLFAKLKNTIKSFCEHMVNVCRTNRDSTQNKVLKGIYNTFYGIFMHLAGLSDQLRNEREAEKLRKEAEKQKDELNKQLEKAGGDSTSTNPNAATNGKKEYTKNQIEKMLKGVQKQRRDPTLRNKSNLAAKEKHLKQIIDVIERRERTKKELEKTKDADKRASLQTQINQDNDQIENLMILVKRDQDSVTINASAAQKRRNAKLNDKWSEDNLTKDQRRKQEDFRDRHSNNGNKIPAPAAIQDELDQLKRDIGDLKNNTSPEEKRNQKGKYAKKMKAMTKRVREIREKYIVKEAFIEDYEMDFALESFFGILDF